MINNNMKNSFYIITAGCLWGIIAVFVDNLRHIGFDSLQCVAIRALFTALILLIYIMITDKTKLKVSPGDVRYFIGTGIFSIAFFNYCYFEAIKVIGSAAIPALLLYTAPIFVMILSALFFKETITKTKVISLIVTFVGLGLVTGAFTGEEKLSFLSFSLGIGSGLGYALYSIFGKMVIDKYDSVTITFYTFLIAAIAVVPMSGLYNNAHLFCSVKSIAWAVGLAFFSTVLPYMLYTKGLKGMDAGKASILATIEPFVAVIVGVLLFHEAFSVSKVVGMLMIIFAVIFLNVMENKR